MNSPSQRTRNRKAPRNFVPKIETFSPCLRIKSFTDNDSLKCSRSCATSREAQLSDIGVVPVDTSFSDDEDGLFQIDPAVRSNSDENVLSSDTSSRRSNRWSSHKHIPIDTEHFPASMMSMVPPVSLDYLSDKGVDGPREWDVFCRGGTYRRRKRNDMERSLVGRSRTREELVVENVELRQTIDALHQEVHMLRLQESKMIRNTSEKNKEITRLQKEVCALRRAFSVLHQSMENSVWNLGDGGLMSCNNITSAFSELKHLKTTYRGLEYFCVTENEGRCLESEMQQKINSEQRKNVSMSLILRLQAQGIDILLHRFEMFMDFLHKIVHDAIRTQNHTLCEKVRESVSASALSASQRESFSMIHHQMHTSSSTKRSSTGIFSPIE